MAFRIKVFNRFLNPNYYFGNFGGYESDSVFWSRKEKYQQFQSTYEIIQTVILAIFAYFYGVSILLNLDPSWSITSFALFGIWMMLVCIGNYLPKVKRNYFVGIKTPWTLHDEENWNKTHRLWGICYFLLGISLIINAYFAC